MRGYGQRPVIVLISCGCTPLATSALGTHASRTHCHLGTWAKRRQKPITHTSSSMTQPREHAADRCRLRAVMQVPAAALGHHTRWAR